MGIAISINITKVSLLPETAQKFEATDTLYRGMAQIATDCPLDCGDCAVGRMINENSSNDIKRAMLVSP